MRVRLRALTLLLPLTLITGLLAGPAHAAPPRASAYSMPLDNDPQPIADRVSGTCSGVSQRPYDFASIIARYAG